MLEELDYSCGVNETSLPGVGKLLATEEDAYAACKDAHAVAIMTEWDAFKALDWRTVYESMAKPAFVFDGRNILNHAALRDIGFEVFAIGKPIRGEEVFPTSAHPSPHAATSAGAGGPSA
jgi:UDPglucose 6-dehydrogenase